MTIKRFVEIGVKFIQKWRPVDMGQQSLFLESRVLTCPHPLAASKNFSLDSEISYFLAVLNPPSQILFAKSVFWDF